MPVPGLGSISAIIHMLAKGPDVARSKSLMRVLGTVLLSLRRMSGRRGIRLRPGFTSTAVLNQLEFGQRHRGPFTAGHGDV